MQQMGLQAGAEGIVWRALCDGGGGDAGGGRGPWARVGRAQRCIVTAVGAGRCPLRNDGGLRLRLTAHQESRRCEQRQCGFQDL